MKFTLHTCMSAAAAATLHSCVYLLLLRLHCTRVSLLLLLLPCLPCLPVKHLCLCIAPLCVLLCVILCLLLCLLVCTRACVRERVHMRACVCGVVCVRACVRSHTSPFLTTTLAHGVNTVKTYSHTNAIITHKQTYTQTNTHIYTRTHAHVYMKVQCNIWASDAASD